MDAVAKLTSKGQLSDPQVGREPLDLHEGDHVVFHVEGGRAVLSRTENLRLGGSMAVPASRSNATWDEVRLRRRTARQR